MNKRGVELAISTLVIIVLALVMLVLGVVFVQKAMCTGINGIDSMDAIIKEQMRSIFVTDDKPVVVKERENEVTRGVPYNVAFLIKNDEMADTSFSYDIEVADVGSCPVTLEEAEDYIVVGKQGQVDIPIGGDYGDLIRLEVPNDADLCTLRYRIVVENGGTAYGSDSFDVTIKRGSVLTKTLC
ncbi:MAG: hypothetical protein ABH864_02580 [archaeon]